MKKGFNYLLVLSALIAISMGVSSCYYDNEAYLYNSSVCSDTVYTYNGRIKPIIEQSCAISGCHTGSAPASNIGLDTYADVKANTDTGELLCTIYWSNGCQPMPKNGAKLDNCTIKAIEEWKTRGFPEN